MKPKDEVNYENYFLLTKHMYIKQMITGVVPLESVAIFVNKESVI